MTYIGSVKDSGGSMSDERRMEQERIQGFCSSMPSDDQAAWDCAERFRGLAERMGAIGAAMNNAAAQSVHAMAAGAFNLPVISVPNPEMANQINSAMNAAQQQAPLPYLIVPRQERTEVEMLREKLAAMEALIASLTPPEPVPVPNVMARAISRWPGSQGFLEDIRWRSGR